MNFNSKIYKYRATSKSVKYMTHFQLNIVFLKDLYLITKYSQFYDTHFITRLSHYVRPAQDLMFASVISLGLSSLMLVVTQTPHAQFRNSARNTPP